MKIRMENAIFLLQIAEQSEKHSIDISQNQIKLEFIALFVETSPLSLCNEFAFGHGFFCTEKVGEHKPYTQREQVKKEQPAIVSHVLLSANKNS